MKRPFGPTLIAMVARVQNQIELQSLALIASVHTGFYEDFQKMKY